MGRQLNGARRELLDDEGYDRMIMMEDDIEVGETYPRPLLNLSDWADKFEDVGCVQVWNVQSGEQNELLDEWVKLF